MPSHPSRASFSRLNLLFLSVSTFCTVGQVKDAEARGKKMREEQLALQEERDKLAAALAKSEEREGSAQTAYAALQVPSAAPARLK